MTIPATVPLPLAASAIKPVELATKLLTAVVIVFAVTLIVVALDVSLGSTASGSLDSLLLAIIHS